MEYKKFENDSVFPALGAPFFEEHLARYLYLKDYVRGKTVMELGCGKGYGSYLLSQNAKEVLACDLNDESLEFARSYYQAKNLSFKNFDVVRAESKMKYNIVLSLEVFEHIFPSQTEDFLKSAISCMETNGELIISTPNHSIVQLSGMPVPEFHINNVGSKEFKEILLKYFKNVNLVGQINDRGPIKNTAYFLDQFNVRHSSPIKFIKRFVRRDKKDSSRAPSESVNKGQSVWNLDQGIGDADKYVFSPWLWKQAGMVMAFCKNPN